MENWGTFLREWFDLMLSEAYLPYTYVGVGCALLLIVLFALKGKRNAVRVFRNTSGCVYVSNKALSELLLGICAGADAVHKARVRFKMKRGKLHFFVQLKLEEGHRLSDTIPALQTRLTQTLQDLLSLEKIGHVDVKVVGFLKNSGKPLSVSKASVGALEPTVSGGPATVDVSSSDDARFANAKDPVIAADSNTEPLEEEKKGESASPESIQDNDSAQVENAKEEPGESDDKTGFRA